MAGLVRPVLAQQETGWAAFTDLQSQHFPYVRASVAVADAAGPMIGLSQKNFEVQEGETDQPVTDFTVQFLENESLRVVLIINTATSDHTLAEMKAAVLSFLARLQPKDKTALLTCGDKVVLEYSFTNNTEALQAAVGRLSRVSGNAVLYQAAEQAVEMLGRFSRGRKAVIILTDRLDAGTPPSSTELLNRFRESGVSLYLIGFGEQVGASPLARQTTASGGQYFAVSQAEQARNALLMLEKTLRQVYQIQFQSRLPADGQTHPLKIRLVTDRGQATVQGQFLAVPGEVKIIPQGIAAGEQVSGQVRLGADIISPAAVQSVAYFLDDELLAEVTTAPFEFAWDTTTAPAGEHFLTIQAVDRAGNQGKVRLRIVVVPPIRLTVSVPDGQITIGEPATITATVDTLTGIKFIEWLWNGRLLARQTAPPFGVRLDSRQYSPGIYQMTIRVADPLEHIVTEEVALELVAPPPPPPSWWQRVARSSLTRAVLWIGGGVVAGLLTLLVAVMAAVGMTRYQRNKCIRRSGLEIINTGNVQCRYRLYAEDSAGQLAFAFRLNGTFLPPEEETLPAPETDTPHRLLPVSRMDGSPSGTRQKIQQVDAVQSRAYRGVSTGTQWLSGLAQMLGGTTGRQIGRFSDNITRQAVGIDRVIRTQTQRVRTVEYFRSRVSGAASRGAPAVGEPSPQKAASTHQPVIPATRTVKMSGTAITPPIPPGDTLRLELIMIPHQPFRTGNYRVTITSHPLDVPDAVPVSV
ncbi:MAG: VWA domain-containing protein, partial [Chloroflexi bacterium]